MKGDPMVTAVGVSAGESAQHRRTNAVCELEGSEARARRHPEKADENAFIVSRMLIE